MARALVWFKRDLRTDDHAPLIAAAACDEALGLFVVEPAWLVSPEFEPQHLAFLTGCIDALRPSLHALGLPLLLRCAPLTQVLEDLHRRLGFTHLFSHEETGPRWTWDRDRAVARWCRERG
ncbi:MAG: deoxyribodipyrimidine photo-lyase, partial [Rubrivivax sp.]|nr:deoxyribodipyrimidine photo-lyase [Rubrivivax sp.]